MRRFILTLSLAALLVPGGSTLAQAEDPAQPLAMPELEIDFAGVTDVQLDAAFERMLSKRRQSELALQDPAGPTNMACAAGPGSNDPETCTVTASHPAAPAAAAGH